MGVGRDTDSYVSVFVKYMMFFANLVFWIVGCTLIGVGAWAYIEKDKFDHKKAENVYDVIFDVAIVITVVGVVIFLIAFAGCLGALRENVFLLKCFSYSLGVIFIMEVVGAILAFVFSGEVKTKLGEVIQEEGLIRYRDDPDFQSLVDWFQETFSCCGVGVDGYRDWSLNSYFNCTEGNPSIERCAVPYSCCLPPTDSEYEYVNTACGYNTQQLSIFEAGEIINTDGCIGAVLKTAEANLLTIGGIAIGLAVPQLMGIFVARILANQVEDQRDRWV